MAEDLLLPKAPAAAAIDQTAAIAMGDRSRDGNVPQQNSGEESDQVKDQQVSVLSPEPLGYYAIVEEIEEQATFGLITFDCVDVKFFWTELQRGKALYKPLSYEDGSETDRSERAALLREMLKNEGHSRCFVLLFLPKEILDQARAVFMPGVWYHAEVKFAPEADEKLLTAYAENAPKEPTVLVTTDLFSDDARPGTFKLSGRALTEEERAFLEEIYSLNHVPDADFGGEPVTPVPPVPAPIILSHGGFSFEGTPEFWQKPDPALDAELLDEDGIVAWPEGPGRAHCRTNNLIYDVTLCRENTGIVDEYWVELRRDDHRFELFVAYGGVLKAECVLPAEEAELFLDVNGVPEMLIHKEQLFRPVDEIAATKQLNLRKPLAPITGKTPLRTKKQKPQVEISLENKENVVNRGLDDVQYVVSPKDVLKKLNARGNYRNPLRASRAALEF